MAKRLLASLTAVQVRMAQMLVQDHRISQVAQVNRDQLTLACEEGHLPLNLHHQMLKEFDHHEEPHWEQVVSLQAMVNLVLAYKTECPDLQMPGHRLKRGLRMEPDLEHPDHNSHRWAPETLVRKQLKWVEAKGHRAQVQHCGQLVAVLDHNKRWYSKEQVVEAPGLGLCRALRTVLLDKDPVQVQALKTVRHDRHKVLRMALLDHHIPALVAASAPFRQDKAARGPVLLCDLSLEFR
jgi:hypothetical protein